MVDIGLESSLEDGELLATRLLSPGPFAMTAGAAVLLELEMLEDACNLLPGRLGDAELTTLVDDRRFAEALYTVALADGMIGRLSYWNPSGND